MKKNSIAQFIGVIVSFAAMWLVNDVVLVGPCIENGGSFNYSKGYCLLENGDVQVAEWGNYLIAIYFFMGILIALSVAFLIRKVFNIKA